MILALDQPRRMDGSLVRPPAAAGGSRVERTDLRRRDRFFGPRRRLNGRGRTLNGRLAKTSDRIADVERRVENFSHRKATLQAMPPDGFEPCRGNTPALRAVGIAAELTRHNPLLQV